MLAHGEICSREGSAAGSVRGRSPDIPAGEGPSRDLYYCSYEPVMPTSTAQSSPPCDWDELNKRKEKNESNSCSASFHSSQREASTSEVEGRYTRKGGIRCAGTMPRCMPENASGSAHKSGASPLPTSVKPTSVAVPDTQTPYLSHAKEPEEKIPPPPMSASLPMPVRFHCCCCAMHATLVLHDSVATTVLFCPFCGQPPPACADWKRGRMADHTSH